MRTSTPHCKTCYCHADYDEELLHDELEIIGVSALVDLLHHQLHTFQCVIPAMQIGLLLDEEGWLSGALVWNTIHHVDTTRTDFQVVHFGQESRFVSRLVTLQEDVRFHFFPYCLLTASLTTSSDDFSAK